MMVKKQGGLPAGFDVNNPICPDCNGPMWDNRTKKEKGEYKPNRSDFSCKDKDTCGKGVWMTDEEKAALSPARPNGAGAAPAVRVNLPPEARKAGRDKVVADYFGLMKLAAERMAIIANQHGAVLDMGNVQAATYSVYGLMEKHGYLSAPARAPAAPAAAPAAAAAPSPPRRAPAPVAAGSGFEEGPYEGQGMGDLPF